MVVDRYYSWHLVYRATDLSSGELVRVLRGVFTSYQVAEEFTSHRATVITGHVFEELCKTWGVQHRVSSAHHPHSNFWEEVAVRTINRFVANCTGLEAWWIQTPSLRLCCSTGTLPAGFWGLVLLISS